MTGFGGICGSDGMTGFGGICGSDGICEPVVKPPVRLRRRRSTRNRPATTTTMTRKTGPIQGAWLPVTGLSGGAGCGVGVAAGGGGGVGVAAPPEGSTGTPVDDSGLDPELACGSVDGGAVGFGVGVAPGFVVGGALVAPAGSVK